MNNVHAVVLRTASSCLRPQPSCNIRSILTRTFCLYRDCAATTRNTISTTSVSFLKAPHPSRPKCLEQTLSRTTQIRSFRISQAWSVLRPVGSARSASKPVEQGLAFRDTPLSADELRDVFGEVYPPQHLSNRLLRVLHGRRIDGTLDLSLPADIEKTLRKYPYAMDSGLHWLRSNYYVDEDEAILTRIDREEGTAELESPSELMQRGQNLGLYGAQSGQEKEPAVQNATVREEDTAYYGPQSGKFRAELSEKENDVFGRSQLERIQAENKAKAAVEEEELEKQIAQIQEREIEQRSQDTALASRPEQGVEAAHNEIRPPNEFEKWILKAKNRASSKLTLDSPEIAEKSMFARLAPSGVFVLLSCMGLYMFAQFWGPPDRSDRVWPNLTLSFATIAGILAANLGVWFLWRVPPAWPLLNRYFIVVPATLKPLSLLGNIFSHMSLRHLVINAVPLLVFGPGLHEELGRGHFLALYLASGLLGSYVSMARYVSRGILNTSALGASGSTWAVTAGFLSLHASDKFTVFFLPEDMKDQYSIRGWMFLAGLLSFEVAGVLTGRLRRRNIDYIAHFTGAATGWLYAEVWKRREASFRNQKEFVAKPTRPWWQQIGLNRRGNESMGK